MLDPGMVLLPFVCLTGLFRPGLEILAFSWEVIFLSLGLLLSLFYNISGNCNHQCGSGKKKKSIILQN